MSGRLVLGPDAERYVAALLRAMAQRAAGTGEHLPPLHLDLLAALRPVAPLAQPGCATPPSALGEVLLSTRSAARRAGCTGQAIRRAAARGTLTASKVDGEWQMTAAAVDRWAEAYRVGRRVSVAERAAQDEAELRTLVAGVEEELAAIETRLAEAEQQRQAALAVAAAGDAAGSALDSWRASEQAALLASEIADLTARARPLRDRRSTALQLLAPMEQRRREISQQEVIVRVQDHLHQRFLTAVDAAVEAFDQVADELRAQGMPVNVHTTRATRDLVRAWRPGGSARDALERQTNPTAARQRLAHLRQEAA